MSAVGDVELMGGAVRPQVRFVEKAQIGFGHGFAVEQNGDVIFVAGDFDMVPFAGGFHGVFGGFDQVVNRAGVVEAGALGVVDGDFDAIKADVFAGARIQRGGADEDSTIAMGTDFEVENENEILPLLSMDEHVMAAFVRVESTVFDGSFAGLPGAGHPAFLGLAVKEEDPAGGFLGRGQLVVGIRLTQTEGGHEQEKTAQDER